MRANKHSERPSGPFKMRLSVIRNTWQVGEWVERDLPHSSVIDISHLNANGETKDIHEEDQEKEGDMTDGFVQHRVHYAQLLREWRVER